MISCGHHLIYVMLVTGQHDISAPELTADAAELAEEPVEQASLPSLPRGKKADKRTRAEQRLRRRQQQKIAQQRYRCAACPAYRYSAAHAGQLHVQPGPYCHNSRS